MVLLLPPIPDRLPWGVTRGLTNRYPLDDGSCDILSGAGVARDIVGGNYVNNFATGAAAPVGSDGLQGSRALKWGSSNGALYWSSAPIANTGWTGTVSFWMWMDQYTATDGSDVRAICIGTTNPLIVAISNGGGGIDLTYGGTEICFLCTVVLSRWQHVAASWNGSAWVFYFNGTKITSTIGGLGDGSYAGIYSFGGRYAGGGAADRGLVGRMQDVRFYTGTVLTDDEVAQLYNSAFTTDEVMPALFVAAATPSVTALYSLINVG